MKQICFALLLGLVLTRADVVPARAQSVESLFGAAQHQEEVEGNLKAAINSYQKVIQKAGANRELVARAHYRTGQCHEKLGQREAAKSYENIVKNFADQGELVVQARARLVALGGGSAALGGETVRKVLSNGSGSGPRLSQDGRFVTYCDESSNEIALFDLATGEQRNVTNHGTYKVANGHPENPIFSPDGKYVAYEMGLHDGKTEIRLNRTEGPQMRTLYATPQEYAMTLLDWSVDGKWILARLDVSRRHAGKVPWKSKYGELSVADGNWRNLLESTDESFGESARISKDGASFAYDKEGDIHIVAVDGTRRSLLVGGIAKDQLVDWSPDGKSLLFTSDRGSMRVLWRVRVENMAAVGEPEILKADLGAVEPVDIAQDGTILGTNWEKKSDAWMTALDLANGKLADARALVTNTPAGLTGFAGWSPDGSKAAAIGFKTLDAFDGRTLVIRPATGGESRLRVLDIESGAVTEVAVVRTSWWGARFSTAWTPDALSCSLPPWILVAWLCVDARSLACPHLSALLRSSPANSVGRFAEFRQSYA